MIPIDLPNDPYEAGRAHGEACRETIRAFLDDRLSRINALRAGPLPLAEAIDAASAHARIVFRDVPAVAEEVRGLAHGAAISEGEAFLLQFRREIVARDARSGHGCSLLVTELDPGVPTLAQTIDLEGDVVSLVRVFRSAPGHSSRPRKLIVSLAGLIGYAGMNDRGLCIGINMLLAQPWKVGVSPYLLVNHLLGLDNLDDCLADIHRIKRASSRSLMLLQGRRCINVEMTPDECRVTEAMPFAHTNHFLHPDLAPQEALNPFTLASSRKRQAHLENVLRRGTLRSVEDVFQALSDHSLFPLGICMHSQGIVTRPDTVAAILMQPSQGSLHIRHGHPCSTQTEVFNF
jgi:hypothetical protein